MNTLLTAIKDKEPILFIGAGFSKCLGLPDWKGLTFKILDLFEEDEEVKASYKTLIEKNKQTFLNTIDEYETRKGKIYAEVLKKDLQISDSNEGLEKYEALWKISNKIITTNYDKALDITGNNSKEVITNKNGFELARLSSSSNYLLKLHGTLDDAESCTLFSSDYATIYEGNTLVKDVFENIIKNNIIIFIGFSMTDPYIKELFEKINTLYKSYLDNHFIVTVNNKNDFSNLNIKPIDVDNWQSGLGKFLNDLIINKSREYTATANPAHPLQAVNTSPINILNSYPNPDLLFTGRETEKIEFQNSLANYRLFAIEGLGGYGKTDFAAKCIEEFIEKKENIVWLDGNSESKFEVFVQSMGYGEMMKGENKTTQIIFSSLKDLIERDKKIIFIDNFQSLTDILFVKFIEYSKKYLNHATLIIITKKEIYFDGAPPHTVVIKGLDANSIEFAEKIRNSESRFSKISDGDLEILSKNTLGHPLAIKLSMTLLEKGINVNSLVSKIAEYKGQGLSEVEELTKRIFDEVYEHPTTTEKEKSLLQLISVFNGKLPLEALNFLFEEDCFIPLSNLGDKFLINKDGGQFDLHPLIKELAYQLLDDKIAAHTRAAEYYFKNRTENLEPILEEQIFYHLSQSNQWKKINNEIDENGRQFLLLGQLSLVKEFIDKLAIAGINNPLFDIFYGDIEQINASWEKAIEFYSKASSQNENTQVKAEGILKTGEIYYRKGDIKEAKESFETAYTFSKENNLQKEEARAINDLALIDDFLGDFKESLIKNEKALVIRIQIKDNQGVANSLNNIGYVLHTLNKPSEALKKLNECLKIRIDIGDKSGQGTALHKIGEIYYSQNRFKESWEKYQESLKIKEEIGDKQGIAVALSGIGKFYFSQNKINEALEADTKSLKIRQEIGDKVGIAKSLSNIAFILNRQNKPIEALRKQEEGLTIFEEIGDKYSFAESLNNIAFFYANEKVKDYKKSIFYSLKSMVLFGEMGLKPTSSLKLLGFLRDEVLEKSEFTKIAYEFYEGLSEKEKIVINIREICKESHRLTNPSKNQLCPCGSGRLYKRCHGKN